MCAHAILKPAAAGSLRAEPGRDQGAGAAPDEELDRELPVQEPVFGRLGEPAAAQQVAGLPDGMPGSGRGCEEV